MPTSRREVMYVPLIILAVFAVGVAWKAPFGSLSLQGLLEQSRPAGTDVTVSGAWVPLQWPSEHLAHQARITDRSSCR